MSASSSSRSNSTAQGACLDPLDALLDLSEYEPSYQSPASTFSPATTIKREFARPTTATPNANNATLLNQQTLSAPSHNYNMYKQQTGIPVGEIQNTLALNGNTMFNSGYNTGYDDFIDFGSAPQPSFDTLDMDLEFDSPTAEPAFFYPEQSQGGFVNPSAVQSTPTVPTQASTSNVGRLWPGMHQQQAQQAALAKAQQQQRIIQQQQAQRQQPPKSRSKSHQPTDPLVEDKISQLLNSMRHSSVSTSAGDDASQMMSAQAQRMRKDEEDMDEDERLLASEEGKKLSSKERRQLRNKVSARAFRSRRKEYIQQLEGEIATKVTENNDLRVQNRALLEENTRLSDLTRMLLSSPSFSGFLENLTTNAPPPAPQQQQMQPPQAPVMQEQIVPTQDRRLPKDVNPYMAQQAMQQQAQASQAQASQAQRAQQHQQMQQGQQSQQGGHNEQINLAILPDHNIDFSMLDLGSVYQPQVFSVFALPETRIDADVLSGKTSTFVGETNYGRDDKLEMPVIETVPVKEVGGVEGGDRVLEELEEEEEEGEELDESFALFSKVPTIATEEAGDAESTPEEEESLAIARSQRVCARIEELVKGLERFTTHL